MTSYCPNCRQPVLPNDVACWQCGWELAPEEDEVAISLGGREPFGGSMSLQRLVVYSVWTVVIVMSTWLAVRTLGSQPVVIATEAPAQTDWQSISDVGQGFTFNLPPSWLWVKAGSSAGTDQILANPDARLLFEPTLAHFARQAGDASILGAAIEAANDDDWTSPPPFFLVARSPWLGRLTSEQIMLLAREQMTGLELRETSFRQSSDGQLRPTLIFELASGEETLRCQQQTVAAGDAAYILTACAPLRQYRPTYADMFAALMAGFQLLASP